MTQGFLNRKTLRLFLELLLIVGVAEGLVMLVLPQIAPNASDSVAAVLDAGMLTVLCAPLLLWRFVKLAGSGHTQTDSADETALPTGWRALFWPLATLVLGLALSTGVAYSVHGQAQREAQEQFSSLVDRLKDDTVSHFEESLHGLNGLAGFYNASKSVERREFDAFWAQRDITQEFPGVRSFVYIQPVMREDLESFVAAERADDFPEYTVKSQGTEPELFLVRHVVNTTGSRNALGIDLYAEPERRAVLQRAIQSGTPELSGLLQLNIGPKQRKPGLLFMQAVYKGGKAPLAPSQRRGALLGVVSSAMILDEMMVQTVTGALGLLEFDIYDSAQPGTGPLMFRSNPGTSAVSARFEDSRIFAVGGRTLAMRVRGTPAFEVLTENSRPTLLGSMGVLLTLLLTAGAWLLTQGRALAEHRARQMSSENDRLAAVVQLTNNSVVIANAKGEVEWANRAFTKITGFTLEEAKGQSLADLRGTQDSDPVAYASLSHALAEGVDIRVQAHNKAPNGQDYWLDQDIQLLRDANGKTTGLVAVETDITSEKRAGETLAMALMETAALMNTINMHSIVSEADAAGNIISINYAFEKISGYSREELIGRNHRIVNSGVHPHSFWAEMWATISSGNPWHAQVCNRAKDGSLYWVDSLVAPFRDSQGVIVKYVSIRTDITQSKNYQTALQEAREVAEEAARSKGQFLANMSHEIRTPMNAILGMLSLLQKTDLDKRQADYASKTEGAAQSLLGLLNDILDFSKVEAGKMTLDLQPFRLDRLLRDLSVVLSSNVGAKNIEVLFDIDPIVPQVLLGDSLRLQQVLINLGGNAVKFTSTGQLVIAVRPGIAGSPAGTLVFSVKDSGIGIAPENQGHIFTGFSQAEASTSRRFGGTGLGLAISQRLVDVMGGELQLTSALGQGSTFHFAVVLPTVTDIPETLKTEPQPSLEHQRVLVVDDNPVAGELLRKMALDWNWDAQLVSSGEAALQHLQDQHSGGMPPCQVIILDWKMPGGMDGWDAARQIRQLCKAQGDPQPTIIMVTAHGRETLSQRTQEEQDLLNGFLVKPVTSSMLLEAVADALSGHSTMRHRVRAASQRRLKGLRLLVVEDNLINQQVAEELLHSEGAMVSLAANGQLGVDAVLAANPQFDAVLMDVQMPVLDGYAATRVLRKTHGLTKLPIIAMTANAMASDRDACLEAGMDDHIGKPFDLTKLVELLARMTGHSIESALEQAAEYGSNGEHLSSLPLTPGVDLAQALARMSGMTSLYLRTARYFALALPRVVPVLEAALQAQDVKAATMHLHSVKGNAGTLGLQDLADEAGRLEKLGQQPDALQAALASNPNLFHELAQVVKTSLAALQHTMTALDDASAPLSSPSAATQGGTQAQLKAALAQLAELLKESDLGALECFAELRPVLSALPEDRFMALEAAMQDLDLETALGLCT